jgi:hypothetical protein
MRPSWKEEISRLNQHFDRALPHLRALPTEHLTALQTWVRVLLIDELEHYVRQGAFPRNYVSKDRTPVFVDPEGRPCAVAHLLQQSGEAELVSRIAAQSNLERVNRFDPVDALLHWLDAAGLQLEDAMVIQPSYDDVPTYNGECFCGGDAWSKFPKPVSRGGYSGAVEVVGAGNFSSDAQVVTVYGDTGLTVGAKFKLQQRYLKQGDRLLIPLYKDFASKAFVLQFEGAFAISSKGDVRCETLPASPPVKQEVVAHAIQLSPQKCYSALGDLFWQEEYEPPEGSGCQVSGDTNSAHVLILLALLASRAARFTRPALTPSQADAMPDAREQDADGAV